MAAVPSLFVNRSSQSGPPAPKWLYPSHSQQGFMADIPYIVPSTIPDDDEDKPAPGKSMTSVGALNVPEIVFGAATLSELYNKPGWLCSDAPYRTVRLALRYGIRWFDTSPHYGQSEVVLGAILQKLAPEFPRSSYRITTKCGREGQKWDYSPSNIRASIMRSLRRLNTSYLDVALLHDIEFVASPVWPIPYCGDYERALSDPSIRAEWGLNPDKAARAWGRGDDMLLDAIRELQNMKKEGIVREVGISCYPLPTLLRISRLVASTSGMDPLDVVLSFSHTTLQNNRLELYINPILQAGKVRQVFTAAPLSMGLLGPNRPSWHPAPQDMIEASRLAQATAASSSGVGWPGGLPNLALSYSFRRPKSHAEMSPYNDVPTVVGLSSTQEVHDAMAVWREVSIPGTNTVRKFKEDVIRSVFNSAGWLNWSWSAPQNPEFDKLAVDQLNRRIRRA